LHDHISIQLIPEWVGARDLRPNVLTARLRNKLEESQAQHCVAVDYEAEALGSPDPRRTVKPRAIQETAADSLHFVNLAFWLAHPTALSFDLITHAVNHDTEWVIRQIVTYEPIRAMDKYAGEEYTSTDIEKTRSLYQGIAKLPHDGTVLQSGGTTIRALQETGWTLRFLLLWIDCPSA
jgi:hypothetical protein